MIHDTRIALFLMGELVAALRANDSDAFRGLAVWGWKAPYNISGHMISAVAWLSEAHSV